MIFNLEVNGTRQVVFLILKECHQVSQLFVRELDGSAGLVDRSDDLAAQPSVSVRDLNGRTVITVIHVSLPRAFV